MVMVPRGSHGFTLIELIIVIVILGTLSVTAAPKLLDLGSDAKSSVLQSLAGSMRQGAEIVHSKAIIQNVHRDKDSVEINGALLPVENGYPAVDAPGRRSGVKKVNEELKLWMDIDSLSFYDVEDNPEASDFFVSKSNSRNEIHIFLTSNISNHPLDSMLGYECYVIYRNQQEANNPQPPKVTVYDSDC